MKLSDINHATLSPQIAYIVGLIYPLIRTYECNGCNYLVGSVSYGVKKNNPVTSDEILSHFLQVTKFLSKLDITIVANNSPAFGTINKNKGFSILIENDSNDCGEIILYNKVKNICNSSDIELKKYLIRGCFDGRGSFDGSSMFPIDIDRVPRDSHILATLFPNDRVIKGVAFLTTILEDLEIDHNVNLRNNDAKRDQLRIKKSGFNSFLNKVGLFSVNRTNDLQ